MTPLLQVFDMPTSIRFYRDLLGFELIGDSGQGEDSDWVLLRSGGVDLMLNTAYERPERPAAPDPARTDHHQDIGLFFSCPDPDAAYRHFTERGVEASPPKTQGYGMRQVYVKDPDGYMLCFHWPVREPEQCA
jgi:catechol 2,3-dioxygenase-like lactoylglutathione lyase family enzyme